MATGTETDAATASGTDYTLNATSLTIAQGASTASTTISVVDDNVKEGTETITLTASSANTIVAGVKGSLKVANISIADNEAAVATMTTSANKVTYVDLLCENSVDAKIVDALRDKISIANEILGEELKEWL